MNAPVTQLQIDQRVFDLYDEYCHGRIDRREFLARSAALVAGGLVMAQALLPRYLLHRYPHQGAVRELRVTRRQLGADARVPGAAERQRAVPVRAGGA